MASFIKSAELSNSLKLPYLDQGDPSGVPLILLHGYADSCRSFELLLPHLPKSIWVIALTQRGHGDASRPPEGYRSHDFAGDLAAFMDSLQIEAAVIAGGSSGGFVARRFAIDFPERTLGLIFLGSPFILRDKQEVLELWESTVSKLHDPIDPGFVREFLMSTYTQPVSQTFLEAMVQESLKVPAGVWKRTFKGLLEDNSSEELAEIKAPTLIIWGEEDTIVPLSDQKKLMAGIRGSRFVVCSRAGHALYWERPRQVASNIVAFVENIVSRYES